MIFDDARLGGDQATDTGFHLSLVMAGAVSAGAYTSGVLDFLIEALDAMTAAQEAGTDNIPPNHKVTIDTIIGASAGGIGGALLASVVRSEVEGVKGPNYNPTGKHSRLYKAWVTEVDIKGMCRDDDLVESKGQLRSLLNTSGPFSLDGIGSRAIDVAKSRTGYPRWLRKTLPIYVTTSNIRGVPYDVGFSGESGNKHFMSFHADFAKFVYGEKDPGWTGHHFLDFNLSGPKGAYPKLKEAALGTAAFPAAFPTRLIHGTREYYEASLWPVPKEVADGSGRCVDRKTIAPTFANDDNRELGDYPYRTIDGGTLNNEPFEMGRLLITDNTFRNTRDAERSTRKLVMIDPFPNEYEEPEDPSKPLSLVESLGGMLHAMKNQSRFKPTELGVSRDGASSRYIIAPSRYDGTGKVAVPALACGCLNAFGGLLDVSFRHHDYMLGRMNTQRFLQRHFVVPVTHRLISDEGGWTAEQIDHWKVDGQPFVPVIPLVGELADERALGVDFQSGVPILPWPDNVEARLPEIEDLVRARVRAIVKTFADSLKPENGGFWPPSNWLKLAKAWAVGTFVPGIIAGKVMPVLIKGLKKHKLLRENYKTEENSRDLRVDNGRN